MVATILDLPGLTGGSNIANKHTLHIGSKIVQGFFNLTTDPMVPTRKANSHPAQKEFLGPFRAGDRRSRKRSPVGKMIPVRKEKPVRNRQPATGTKLVANGMPCSMMDMMASLDFKVDRLMD